MDAKQIMLVDDIICIELPLMISQVGQFVLINGGLFFKI